MFSDQFPDFPSTYLPTIPPTFRDVSDRADCAPTFASGAAVVFCHFPSDRHRYTVGYWLDLEDHVAAPDSEIRHYFETCLETNDWKLAIAEMHAIDAEFTKFMEP